MTEKSQPTTSAAEDSQSRNGFSQYQHQTLTFHNTLGLVCMSALAFALLIALLRQQARYQELAVRLARPES